MNDLKPTNVHSSDIELEYKKKSCEFVQVILII